MATHKYFGLVVLFVSLTSTACIAEMDSPESEGEEHLGVSEEALTAPTSCSGTITYGQSRSTTVPAITYCFTNPPYDESTGKYHYKLEFGPVYGGSWITSGQQLANWTNGRFAIRVWYNGQVIVQTIKNSGSYSSPISTEFYGLSGQKYYIQVGMLYSNGEFCSLCAVPWSMQLKMTSLGKY